ncbi:calcium-binding protein, partial [Azospira restricta]
TSDTLLTGEDEDGDAVFTIEIVNVGTDDAPVYQLQTTLNEALVHPDNATFDEAVSLWLAEDGAVQLQYEVTREDADGDTVTDSATVDLISRSTDGEEVSNTSYFSFDDDGPTDFYPDTIYTVLGVESPLPEPVTIQSGLNFAMAAGSDGVGTANFNFNLETEESQPFLDADGKQLYMNNEELFISYDPDFDDHQHIIVKTEDGNVAMTGEINADGDVVITMFSGTFISNTKITTVTDLAGIGGGDVPFKGLNIGTKQDPDPDGTNDVLVSSAIRPLGDGDEGSVNSNANELGVGEGNELSNGEIIRYDLVTGLSVNNQQNNESYSFTGYQQTFAFKQTIVVAGESKDADFKLRIYNESGSATNQDVTLVGTSLSTEQRMLTPEEIIIRDGDGVIQDNDLHVAQDGSGLILYDIGNDWTFEIKSVDATDTPEAFNVVEIEAIEAEMVDGTLVLSDETTTSFKLGEFSYGEDTELSPVTIELPVIATDGDGDAVTSDVQLVVYPDTISMVGTDSGETMTGDANANYMFGEGGDDILVGNGGDDILSGDGGNDTFVFNGSSLTEAGSATITDFTLGDPATNPEADILDISDVLLAAHASDSDIPTDLAAAISGGFLKVEVVDGNTAQIVLDFDGSSGGTGSVIPIVTLDNLSAGYDANTLLSTLLGDGDHQLK